MDVASEAEDSYEIPAGVYVSDHPVLIHKFALIRKSTTTSREFRSLFKEISFYLGFEATRDLKTKPAIIKTSTIENWEGRKLVESIAIIPVLRGGLGMSNAMLDLLPNAPVYHIGMYRNPGSNMPVQYYNRLPKGLACEIAMILDPVIVSSKTICAVVGIVKKWGAKHIKVITFVASKPGLSQLMATHPDITVHCGAIDDLSEDGEDVVPGIGDAGDRLFLGPDHINDEDLLSPACKRSRDFSTESYKI